MEKGSYSHNRKDPLMTGISIDANDSAARVSENGEKKPRVV